MDTVSGASTRFPEFHGVQSRHRAVVQTRLSELGPISMGTMAGGQAFGFDVEIDSWLIGPVDRPPAREWVSGDRRDT
jgi:hypothetical protein